MNKFLPRKIFFLLTILLLSPFIPLQSVFAATASFNTTELLQGPAMDLRSKAQISPLKTVSVGPQTGSVNLEAIDRLQVQDTPPEIFFTPLSQISSGVSEDQMQAVTNFITNQIQTTFTNQNNTNTGIASIIQGNNIPLSIQGNATNNNTVNLYVNNPTATVTLSIPTLAQNGTLLVDNLSQTITNKTIDAATNTITNIPNSALQNSTLTINAGNGISVSGSDVGLGGSITISNTGSNSSSGVSSINSQSGGVTITGSGVTTNNGTITISGSGTEIDTLASVTGRGATTSTALTLSSGSNNITAGTLTATGGTLNGVTIGGTSASTALFTTVNGLSIQNNGSNTLNIASGKTATINNSITLAGTDGTTITLPSISGSLINSTSTDTLTNKTLTAPVINGIVTTTGLTLPAFTASGNITGSGSPTVSGLGAINGLTLSASILQPAAAGALTLQSNGANTITIDTGASGSTVNIGNTNATTLGLGNSGSTLNLGGNLDQSASSGTFKTGTGAVSINGATILAANKNLTTTSGTGVIIQNYANINGTATTINATDNSSSGTTTMHGADINLTGNATSGSNTLTGLVFGTVSSIANNVFNALTFGSNLTNILTSPTIGITGAGAITNAASVNGLNFIANATGFSIAGGTTSKTMQINKTLTLDAGADGQTFTFPSVSDTLAGLATTQTFTKPNIFSPGSNAGVALAANATTNATPSNIANFTQSQGGADGVDINLTNTSGTTANGLLVNLNGSGGTVTNGINLNQSAGTLTNGVVLNGTIGTDITSTTTNKGLIMKTNGTGVLTLDSGTTGAINLGTGASAKIITLGNTTAGTALNLTANGPSTWDIGNNILSLQTTNGGAIILGGNATVSAGKTLAVTDADKLTVGGKIIPQSIPISIPLSAAVLTTPVFIADTTYQVTGAKCIPSILSVSGTLQVTVDTGTQAAGAGTSQLASTVNLAGTINTVVSGTVIASPTTINAGDRVSAVFGGTLTGLLGNCTIYLKRV